VADQSVSVPVTFSDLKTGDVVGQIFWRISIITPVQFDLELPNLAGNTGGEEACF